MKAISSLFPQAPNDSSLFLSLLCVGQIPPTQLPVNAVMANCLWLRFTRPYAIDSPRLSETALPANGAQKRIPRSLRESPSPYSRADGPIPLSLFPQFMQFALKKGKSFSFHSLVEHFAHFSNVKHNSRQSDEQQHFVSIHFVSLRSRYH